VNKIDKIRENQIECDDDFIQQYIMELVKIYIEIMNDDYRMLNTVLKYLLQYRTISDNKEVNVVLNNLILSMFIIQVDNMINNSNIY